MQLTSHSEARVSGYKSYIAGDSWDIVSNDPDPAEQVSTLEEALDLPAGESVGLDGRETLARFFEIVTQDIKMHGKRAHWLVLRRVVGIGHRVGCLKGLTLDQLAEASGGVSRQSICQAGTNTEKLIGRVFAREPAGRVNSRRKAATDG